jgi:hypothetical protein
MTIVSQQLESRHSRDRCLTTVLAVAKSLALLIELVAQRASAR